MARILRFPDGKRLDTKKGQPGEVGPEDVVTMLSDLFTEEEMDDIKRELDSLLTPEERKDMEG